MMLILKIGNIMDMPLSIQPKTLLFLACILAAPFSQANEPVEMVTTHESVMIPLIEKVMLSSATLPIRGDSQIRVKKEFGAPFQMHPPKGTPPISRWDFETFSVYFESGVVIHTVLRR
jgi:hypothetical protein